MVKKRHKILFFAEAVTLAHVTRLLVLVKALDRDLFDIHFACAEGFEDLYKNHTLTYWKIHSIPSQQFLKALENGSPVYSYRDLCAYLKDDLKVIDAVQPDLIVGDFRLSLSVSAALRKIPYTSIINAHWSPFAVHGFPLPEHPLVRLFGVKVVNAFFQMTRPLFFAYHSLPINKLRTQNGLPALGYTLSRVYSQGDDVLYTDTPEFVPTSQQLPRHHHYIGPILWSPEIPFPPWWDTIDKGKPIIYVTLGSSGKSDLLPAIITVLKDFPVTAIVATANRIELQDLPNNVYTANYLPGVEAAKVASIVICNGGSATTYQALSAGTPVLGIASNMDQYLTMQAVCRNNAGRLVRAGQANVQTIASALSEIMNNPLIADAASKVAAQFSAYNASDRFTKYLKNRLE